MPLFQLNDSDLDFPEPHLALKEPNGLLAIGEKSPLLDYVLHINQVSSLGTSPTKNHYGGHLIQELYYLLVIYILGVVCVNLFVIIRIK